MASAMQNGVLLSQTSPAFLHANSTSHTWIFSAIAELIDNAYDPDVGASTLQIDTRPLGKIRKGKQEQGLMFTDNGAGMDQAKLHRMLSFGYCEKGSINSSYKPVGQYGNGFKSGSMRLGRDAIVFTRDGVTCSIGFLSQTYLEAIDSDTVLVPIISFHQNTMTLIKARNMEGSLHAITTHSIFKSLDSIVSEFSYLPGDRYSTGTRIIIYNLVRGNDDKYELDLESNPTDIINSEHHVFDGAQRLVREYEPEYRRSLREYCSILFLKPRMKIVLRGVKVKTKLVSKSLKRAEIDFYRPKFVAKPVQIIFGFGPSEEDCGLMLYHRNRLIKAYEKVGCQKQYNGSGRGVVGVVEVDHLEPVHNKQEFNKTDRYNAAMSTFGMKLTDYWRVKTNQEEHSQEIVRKTDWDWVQCDKCLKWRRLPDIVNAKDLPDKWFCYQNLDPTHNRCDVAEEPEDEDALLAQQASYKESVKKRKNTESETRMKTWEQKEQELREREQNLERVKQEIEHRQIAEPSRSRAVADARLQAAQQALEESKRREEHQKQIIEQLKQQRINWSALNNPTTYSNQPAQHPTQLSHQSQFQQSTVVQILNNNATRIIGSMSPANTSTASSSGKRKSDDIEDIKRKRVRREKTRAADVPPVGHLSKLISTAVLNSVQPTSPDVVAEPPSSTVMDDEEEEFVIQQNFHSDDDDDDNVDCKPTLLRVRISAPGSTVKKKMNDDCILIIDSDSESETMGVERESRVGEEGGVGRKSGKGRKGGVLAGKDNVAIKEEVGETNVSEKENERLQEKQFSPCRKVSLRIGEQIEPETEQGDSIVKISASQENTSTENNERSPCDVFSTKEGQSTGGEQDGGAAQSATETTEETTQQHAQATTVHHAQDNISHDAVATVQCIKDTAMRCVKDVQRLEDVQLMKDAQRMKKLRQRMGDATALCAEETILHGTEGASNDEYEEILHELTLTVQERRTMVNDTVDQSPPSSQSLLSPYTASSGSNNKCTTDNKTRKPSAVHLKSSKPNLIFSPPSPLPPPSPFSPSSPLPSPPTPPSPSSSLSPALPALPVKSSVRNICVQTDESIADCRGVTGVGGRGVGESRVSGEDGGDGGGEGGAGRGSREVDVFRQLKELRLNVAKLLKTILPDLMYDHERLEYIDDIIVQMVQVNTDTEQSSSDPPTSISNTDTTTT